MEFKIRENRIGCYIDLYTDNGILIIGGGNKYESREHAEAAINTVKSPVTYLSSTEEKVSDYGDWDRSMAFPSFADETYEKKITR